MKMILIIALAAGSFAANAYGPRVAIEQSWEILQANVVKAAKVLGFMPTEGADSELKQALFYLTTRVLNSQNVMIGVYGLAAARQKVQANPAGEVKAEEAERFALSCMAIIAEPSLQLVKTVKPGQG
jgi:hypothetical protein